VHPDHGDPAAPQLRSTGAPDHDGVGPTGLLPTGPQADDALARLYRWPDGDGATVVRVNMIASLDGATTLDGRSGGLGNAADEYLFTLLRDLADVILVGSGTVRAERYGGIRLTPERADRRTRWGLSTAPPPIAVVTARGLDPGSPLFADTVTPPIVITTESGARRVPDGVAAIAVGAERVDLAAGLVALHRAGLGRVHCEGGPSLLASLAEDDLVDELCLTISPLLLGAGEAAMLPRRLTHPLRWSLQGAHVAGDHVFTRYRRDPARVATP